MLIIDEPNVHLTYCLNIHPGGTWKENFQAISRYVLAVQQSICAEKNKKFGLGLRLSNKSARRLVLPHVIESFKNFMAEKNLYVFTINGFPYGKFHGKSVKTDVYAPDWRTKARQLYTIILVNILQNLLPDAVEGSISTVPGSYSAWIKDNNDSSLIAANLAQCAWHCFIAKEKTGKTVRIGLEPEPDCLIENTKQAIGFFKDIIFTKGTSFLAAERKISRKMAENVIREHIGLCFDTCHFAVQFEDLQHSLQEIIDAGINVCKVQISAALKVYPQSDAVMRTLKKYLDEVYLHQIKFRSKENVFIGGYSDMFRGLINTTHPEVEWRIHFHVPLYFHGTRLLGTTAYDVDNRFLYSAVQKGISHFEIETYTFGVLPEEMQKEGVVSNIIKEYKWVMNKFKTIKRERCYADKSV